MRKLFKSFGQFVEQITKDLMLFVVCFAPILCGLFFKFGIPLAESLLTKQFHCNEILTPYYLMFDLFLAVMTPIMFCFVSAMIILGEIDDKISNYIAVTPLGNSGYLISRLGFPTVIATITSMTVLPIFSLTKISFLMLISLSILTAITGLIVSMLVVSLSSNKVEGMAVTKLSGLIILGIPAPFFITDNIQYVLFFLPSFWIAKLAIERNYLYIIPAIIISIAWIMPLSKRFVNKLV